ncbi:MAG TPA: ATP-dependent helicase [Microbacteriaceae bacterium]|nr:ATP-dependent helicase [Microbacteriaceae bacterium]
MTCQSTQPQGNQKAAVESSADHLLLVAPPGCGKTEVLAMRAEHLVRINAIRPNRRLLAITYSKRARDNMAQRIQNRLGYQISRRFVTVQNFHGLAGRIVHAHGATLGVPTDVVFPTKRWLGETMSKFTNSRPAKGNAEKLLRTLKSEPLSDEELRAAVEESGDEVAIGVERERREQNRLDYADLLRQAQRLLHVPGIAQLYQEHFDALVVDEFQDLSLQQLDIVTRVCVRNATYVGDPLQGIYSWAGAEPEAVQAEIEARSPERIDLDISYRSSPEVLAMVNEIAVPLGAVALSAADPDAWADTGRNRAHAFATDVAEAAGIGRIVEKLHSDHPTESIGIISRSGWRRKQVDRLLAASEIPLQFWDMALDAPGILGLLRIAARGIRKDRPIADQLAALHSHAIDAVGDGDVDTINEIDDAMVILSERAEEGESVRDILTRFREVDVSESVPAGVHLLNAHIGKGQQFDWVIVIGLEEGHVPDFRSQTDPEEQRVLMVMLSRAKRGLIVTRADRTTTKFGMKAQTASPWWPALESIAQNKRQPK